MIRVFIERRLADNMEQAYYEAVRKIKFEASGMPGYVSGEVLHDCEHFDRWLVISTWQSLRDWERWEASSERKTLLGLIAPMLREPETISIFESAAAAFNDI